jgi:hypothetical protein
MAAPDRHELFEKAGQALPVEPEDLAAQKITSISLF